jgi:hypothetical protein
LKPGAFQALWVSAAFSLYSPPHHGEVLGRRRRLLRGLVEPGGVPKVKIKRPTDATATATPAAPACRRCCSATAAAAAKVGGVLPVAQGAGPPAGERRMDHLRGERAKLQKRRDEEGGGKEE